MDLAGATVISINKGDKLLFVLADGIQDTPDLQTMLDELRAVLPGIQVNVILGAKAVIHEAQQ